MKVNIDQSNFNSGARKMGISPVSTSPRDMNKKLNEGDVTRRGSEKKEKFFSFGKISNRKG